MLELLEFIRELLVEDALIVVPVLWVLGKIVKGTPKARDWTIPYILLGLGIVFTIGILGFNVDAVIQGVLVSGVAVFGHQLLIQTRERGGDNS